MVAIAGVFAGGSWFQEDLGILSTPALASIEGLAVPQYLGAQTP